MKKDAERRAQAKAERIQQEAARAERDARLQKIPGTGQIAEVRLYTTSGDRYEDGEQPNPKWMVSAILIVSHQYGSLKFFLNPVWHEQLPAAGEEVELVFAFDPLTGETEVALSDEARTRLKSLEGSR
jgi:hypothetical protein